MRRSSAIVAIAAVLAAGLVGCDSDQQPGRGDGHQAPGQQPAAAKPAEAAHHQTKTSESGYEPGVTNGFDKMPEPGTKAFCPVMGHDFAVTEDNPSVVHDGKTYVFCCGACKPKFEQDPGKYVKS